MRLAWSGVDFESPFGLLAASRMTELLEATGACPLKCSHCDYPSPLCALRQAMLAAAEHEADVRSSDDPDAGPASKLSATTRCRTGSPRRSTPVNCTMPPP